MDELFPDARYVRILRIDIDRQAVSLWTALQRGVWSIRAGAAAQPPADDTPYSFEGIARCRRAILSDEAHWDRFFRFNRIAPVEVVHEKLADAHAPTIAAVYAGLFGHALDRAEIPAPDSVRQAGARSEALYERFVADQRRLAEPLVAPAGLRSVLRAGESLAAGEALSSPDGRSTLTVDGGLTLRRDGATVWQAATEPSRRRRSRCTLTAISSCRAPTGRALWRPDAHVHPGARLGLADEGLLVLRAPDDAALWNSGPPVMPRPAPPPPRRLRDRLRVPAR